MLRAATAVNQDLQSIIELLNRRRRTICATIMPSRIFSLLRPSSHSNEQESRAPAYSATLPNAELASPRYEEREPTSAHNRKDRPTALSRTVSESNYTSAELSSWNDAADGAQRSQTEDLPPYEERPFIPDLIVLARYTTPAISSRAKRPHNVCPCARCYSLR